MSTDANKLVATFSRDHWSTLAYVETCCVDNNGQLARKRLNDADLRALEDMEDAQLLTNIGTGIQPAYRLTEDGWRIAHAIRRHKAAGGTFKNFAPAAFRNKDHVSP